MFRVLNQERVNVIGHDDRRDERKTFAIEMAQRVIDDCCVFALSQNARTVPSVEPALDRSGEALMVLLFGLRSPGLRMKPQPDFTFILPLLAQMSGNRIGQSKCDEVSPTLLLPVWQQVLCKPNLFVRIKETQCILCGSKGVTAPRPSRLTRRLGSRRSLKH